VGALSVATIRRSAKWWLGILLSAICFVLALRGVVLADVLAALARTNYGLVAVAVVTVVLTGIAKTARWRLLFYPNQAQLRFEGLFGALVIGQMVNLAIPARLGELVRAYTVGATEGVSKSLALGTIVVEKLFDMLMTLLCLILLFLLIYLPLWMWELGFSLAIGTGAVLVVALAMTYQRDRILRGVAALLRLLPPLAGRRLCLQIEPALKGLDVLRHVQANLGTWGWSLLIWVLAVATNYIIFLAMRMALPLVAALFLLVVLQVGGAVPSSPGKVGVFQYLCVLALSLFSVERSVTLGCSLVLYLVVFLPSLLLGAFFLSRSPVAFHALKSGGPVVVLPGEDAR
jgi:uncharacterized protein (TIRG00374 family)